MDYQNNRLLLVDEDKSVLDLLIGLLTPLGCEILSATSPLEALKLLESSPVDIILSEIHLYEMEGECFLEELSQRYPDTERVVITANSDSQSIIDAINKGKVSRFLLKPLDAAQVERVVIKGFELAALKREVEKQHQELQQLNQTLEAKITERTQQLKNANEQIKNSYRSVVRMFSTLTARRMGVKVTQLNMQLNQMLLEVAKRAGIEGKDLKRLFYAWQLRHIGKLSFPDELLHTPYLLLSPNQQRAFQEHPVFAQTACMMVKPLYLSGKIILQHKEYLDGSGYPKGLVAEQIDLRAQVICLMNDYVELITGLYSERVYSTHEAIDYFREKATERYNQTLVGFLIEAISALAKQGEAISDQRITSIDLTPNMRLSRDLISASGMLLLSADQTLDGLLIERIREMEFNLNEIFEIFVSKKGGF